MTVTLAQAIAMLTRYCGANNTPTDRINEVTMRLIQDGNWPSTKETVLFAVHVDDEERAFITLPAQYETVLGGVYFNQRNQNGQEALRCGVPFAVRDEWFSYLQTGPGYSERAWFGWGNGFIPEIDRFTVFRNWYTAKHLRLKFATTESNGLVFNIRGKLDGQIIYTGTGSGMIEGENLTTAGATTLTTSSQFDAIPYGLVKPETYGPVEMYTWDGTEEVLVARYAPKETVPQWRRYRVPACSDWTEADPGFALCVCKRQWVPVSNSNDQVIPGNIGALKFGLQALLAEDSRDFERGNELWQMAFDLLAREAEDDQGAGATSPVQVADSFMLNEGTYAGGSVWNGGWYGN